MYTMRNNTLAWDLKGNFDPYEDVDLEKEMLYENYVKTEDLLREFA